MNSNLKNTIILLLDAYKLFHRVMYPKNTTLVYTNNTFRSMNYYQGDNKDYGIVFGNQYIVRKLKDKFQEFFDTEWSTLEAYLKSQLDSFTGMDYSIEHIKYLHSLGYLPLVVKSLREGTKCPIGVPNLTMYNTDPKCFWLTNALETWMSNNTWQGHYSASISNEYREIFTKWSLKTTGNIDNVAIQGHDFSYRGMGGEDTAILSAMAHLTSFVGSDTVPAYTNIQYYYDTGLNDWQNFSHDGSWYNNIVATSVPATEHSVQCAHYNGEDIEYLDYILEKFPTGIVSIVCDGYDFWKFITEILPQRKEQILARNGKLVVRPDSGDPVDIICGRGGNDPGLNNKWSYEEVCNKFKTYYEHTSKEEFKGAIECLWHIFGGTTNELGYKELDSHIGLIYGDSITLERADDICSRLAEKGFASTNWIAGIGSFTFRFSTRDSMGGAYKATYIEIAENIWDEGVLGITYNNAVGKNIFKDPKTGSGKKSAKGLLRVNEDLTLTEECTWEEESGGLLREIFRDGELLNQENLFTIRKRINNYE